MKDREIDLGDNVSFSNVCYFSSWGSNPGPEITSSILATVNEIEDKLYYFSDVISAGIHDVGRLMTDNLLLLLILPILLPSLTTQVFNVWTSTYPFFLLSFPNWHDLLHATKA